jgi:hypothetical protein
MADDTTDAVAFRMHIDTVDGDVSTAGLQVTVEDVQQGALATTTTAHDADELAAVSARCNS